MLLTPWPQGLQPQTCCGRVCVGHNASWQGEEGRTQTLLEPLQPTQTGMCNETMCRYWHRAVQGDVSPPWPSHLSSPPFQYTQKARGGQDGAVPARGHSGGSKWSAQRHLGWGRSCQP